MNYEIEDVNLSDTYKAGEYFINALDYLYRIITDSERGYALLNVTVGTIESEFHDNIEGLIKYTNVGDMRKVYQTKLAVFTTQFVDMEEE